VQALEYARGLRGFTVFPLHGELPPEQQDRAVARYEARKIIVSTNVAETSLTIDGVTAVIDSGLARVARFDPHRGINTLLIEKISAASADQRAGRAGRTAPGVCVRLWTEREHGSRAPQELPEVRRLDLSEVVLTLKASGIDDVFGFPWLEKPEVRGLERAERLLADLGALAPAERGGTTVLRITETGKRMLRFPVHPRYARTRLWRRVAAALGEDPAEGQGLGDIGALRVLADEAQRALESPALGRRLHDVTAALEVLAQDIAGGARVAAQLGDDVALGLVAVEGAAEDDVADVVAAGAAGHRSNLGLEDPALLEQLVAERVEFGVIEGALLVGLLPLSE
jgi:hypothetical protein